MRLKNLKGRPIIVVGGAGDLSKLYADTSKAEMILGFKTKYSDLENIIQTAWNFYKNKNEGFNPKK